MVTTKPTKPEPRHVVKSVRLRPAGADAVQQVADRDGISWGEAARRMLKYASQSMPAGWH